jgi:hypothetical protein
LNAFARTLLGIPNERWRANLSLRANASAGLGALDEAREASNWMALAITVFLVKVLILVASYFFSAFAATDWIVKPDIILVY